MQTAMARLIVAKCQLLTRPNVLIVLLEYIDFYQSKCEVEYILCFKFYLPACMPSHPASNQFYYDFILSCVAI